MKALVIFNNNIRKYTQDYLELLTPETMKLFGSTKNKITKDDSGENIPHLEITKVVLFIVILLTMIISKI